MSYDNNVIYYKYVETEAAAAKPKISFLSNREVSIGGGGRIRPVIRLGARSNDRANNRNGESGIRTHDPVAGMLALQASAFGRSAISPP